LSYERIVSADVHASYIGLSTRVSGAQRSASRTSFRPSHLAKSKAVCFSC